MAATMLFAAKPVWSREIGPKWLERNYEKIERMIPMRDGVKLYTAIYLPKDGENHPVMMMRTPYGLNPYGKGFHKYLRNVQGVYAENKYIIVHQNVRGTYLSEGGMVQIRPVGEGPVDDATDTYDTAEWIINNLPTNGSIGVSGVSYNGFYATLAAISKHPAIKAVSPQAPICDWFIGDDAHANGAFHNGVYGFGAGVFRERKRPTNKAPQSLVNMEGDCYDWFMEKGSLGNLFAPVVDSLKFFRDMVEHPVYDEFWVKRNPTHHLKDITAAVLVVGGWFDSEDCYGAFETYRKMLENSPSTDTYLVAGPWYHGGWNKLDVDHLGDAWFGKGTQRHYLSNIEYPFFAYYLEGKGEKPSYKAIILPSGETMKSVMENVDPNGGWVSYESWPAPGIEVKRFYLAENEQILCDEPSSAAEFKYVSDPKHPVPFMENTEDGIDRSFMVADQRFAVRRTDVLSFSTDVLTSELHVSGPLKASLKVSMTSTDADMIVKLVDVRPDGTHMLVRHGVMPARFRDGLTVSKPVVPGEIVDIEFMLNDIDHVFMPGHRLEILVQSSMFPLIAMNPQTWLPNVYEAKDSDYVKAEITVHSGSYLELPVMGAACVK